MVLREKRTEEGRQAEYDWLRSISCIWVVILHIAAMYVKEDLDSVISDADYIIASFWRVLSCLAVPSFVMLSGAFLIKDENIDFNLFYRKTLKNIIVPTLVFSILYVLIHYAEIFLAQILGIGVGAGKTELWLPVRNWLQGQPHVTLWYMYMIIPLYLITPVIVMIKRVISEKAYVRLAVIMMFYGVVVSMSCSLSWILQFAAWIGYFMAGGVIRTWGGKIRSTYQKINWRLVGTGFIGAAYIMLIVYWYLFTYRSGRIMVPGDFSWTVVVAVLLQFVGISVMPIEGQNCLRDSISKYSLEVYLIHPLFCEVILQVCGRIVKWFPTAMGIPVYAALVTVVCVGIAKVLRLLVRNVSASIKAKGKIR